MKSKSDRLSWMATSYAVTTNGAITSRYVYLRIRKWLSFGRILITITPITVNV